MRNKDVNTEQAILDAAINEFLSKGYSGAKTTEIAKQAGVNHAMLHYYFRTKKNLFDMVFKMKVNQMSDSFKRTFEEDLPFLEKIKKGIGMHFDLMAEDPRLPFFVYSEVIVNEERKQVFAQNFYPKVTEILDRLEIDIEKEVKEGTICPIHSVDLLINIVSLNVFAFLAQPLLSLLTKKVNLDYDEFLKYRKENNVQVILKSLRP